MSERDYVDLLTEAGERLGDHPWQAYPRPMLRRASYLNLNGIWEFAVTEDLSEEPEFREEILVPFAPQSLLSRIHRNIPDSAVLYYRRRFSLPEGFQRDRVLLHIGAADQIADVWINGRHLGRHAGGYESFAFDITEALTPENTVLIRVQDHLNQAVYPYGKQREKRGGMWYTPVSGIWQTVWMESVPRQYISHIRYETGRDWVKLAVEGGAPDGTVTVHTPDGVLTGRLSNGSAAFYFAEPRLWSPEDPYLYSCTISAGEDEVESYFALRTLSIEERNGISRLCLNGRPYFFHGLLDQGYWSDGLFTPASPDCYEDDIRAMKSLGFNTLRKHIKIEPELFYYACDRLGVVVFQDMVNNGRYSFLRDTALPTVGWKRLPDRFLHRDSAGRQAFLEGMHVAVESLRNHPSICYWTIFNEGWGQFDSDRMYEALKALDASRFIDSTSGWFAGRKGDVVSEHVYFRPFRPHRTGRPLVLSEFGGYSYAPSGHVFHPGHVYGYRKFDDLPAYRDALRGLYESEILPAIGKGLCAAIYTQVSDVEDETNGLLSYDRRIQKIRPADFSDLSARLQEELKNPAT